MGQNSEVPATSGIQVLDRAVFILTVISAEPRTLTDLCDITGLPRATAHRIAVALEKHRLIERDHDGAWTTGPALTEMAPTSNSRLEEAAEHILPKLLAETGESVQLYRISGLDRVCIANANPATGLHDIVPVGHRMSLAAGSAAKILMAYASDTLLSQVLPHAAFTAADLAEIRATEIAESSAERDPSLGSASVPIFDASGTMIAALSLSGPVDRMGPHPATKFGPILRRAAREFDIALRG
ncbi:IclR family transcriptional regulator [Corynebacterium sp. 319]|uniref:IclR family transcriptional regulator n=1 Tax=unclassified Corynebacterium TaxID=2624378 RepID=UPI00125CAEE5|nr:MULTISPECIES: IclR family transcriptional regulator [unclassified Corynebacterium]KAB1553042.1 IclR family transcriptional regulator [Corynebacterium sp. 321]KAB1553737.1 IclR family transcriptional regulator [Corynebacterium sp. 319]KAB3540517.1 IclR family transcriptional regulator [Corynebacterium sp. 366]